MSTTADFCPIVVGFLLLADWVLHAVHWCPVGWQFWQGYLYTAVCKCDVLPLVQQYVWVMPGFETLLVQSGVTGNTDETC